MKKTFIILLITIIFSSENLNAQTGGISDTLAYLRSIVTNKAQFVGQPFSVLKDSLQIQIRFFSPSASNPKDKFKETSTYFAFYFPLSANELYLAYPMLEVSRQPYLNASQSYTLYSQYNGGGWSSAVSAFYASGTIADIQIRE